MPVLETERTILRPFTLNDAADVYAYCKDPRVGPIAGWKPHESEEESREIIRTVFSAPDVFAVTDRETGRVIGSAGFVTPHPLAGLLGPWADAGGGVCASALRFPGIKLGRDLGDPLSGESTVPAGD